MHRQTTTFSSRMNRVFTHRANRVSKAIERQGIRATYELHDRLLSNRSARERFASSPPQLDDAQRGILDEVQQHGFAVRSFDQLFSADEWQAIAEQRDRFVSATEADLAAGGEHVRVRPGKEFVVRLQSYGVELGPDDPWFKVVSSRRLLDLANTYVGMWSKLEYVDVWYSVPQPEAAERISSQRWHRDYNDKHLLKVFLYLVDVDESMGPFQFVAGSQPGGPYEDAWGWQPLGQNYPTEQELESRIPASAVQTFTGPAGTLLFCNTAGFHRGGFSTTKPRVLATATYSSPASLAALTVRSYTYSGAVDALDEPSAVRAELTARGTSRRALGTFDVANYGDLLFGGSWTIRGSDAVVAPIAARRPASGAMSAACEQLGRSTPARPSWPRAGPPRDRRRDMSSRDDLYALWYGCSRG